MSTTYSFLDVNASIVGPGGAFSLGNGAGAAEEGITVTPSGDIGGMLIGADGAGQHSLYADKSGTVTVNLLKTSPVNQLLSLMYAFQTASGATYGQNTLVINDASRGDVITCSQTAFKKAPDLTYAKDGGTNQWEFNVIRIERTLGS
jgi:Protein of unknown function (DUF3277)